MKSGTAESSSASRLPTEPFTSDSASVSESVTVSHPVGGTNETTTLTFDIKSAPSSIDGDSTKKGKKHKGEDKEKKKMDSGSNLVGMITNLVSTDLNNMAGGRDFPMLITSLPLQIVLCIVFLYKVLGWSSVVGMVVMVALYPLPGWVASKVQEVQAEKMKMASHAFPFFPCDSVLFMFLCRRMGAFKS